MASYQSPEPAQADIFNPEVELMLLAMHSLA